MTPSLPRSSEAVGFASLKLRQIDFAGLVVLNKTDLVSPEHVKVVRDWIGLHMKRVRIVEATHGVEGSLSVATRPVPGRPRFVMVDSRSDSQGP
jgi:G3E family GTPase